MNKVGILLIVFILFGMGYTVYSFFGGTSEGDISVIERIHAEEPIELEQYIGEKKTILQFVAVPCECCSYSMPFIQEFIEQQDEIEVITVVFYGREAEIKDKFLNEYEAKHEWGIDLDRHLANYYDVNFSPTYVFFDEDGNNMGSHPYIIATSDELGERFEEAYNSYHKDEAS
ncbi:TlpA family protein disulfide reductase [Evansella halocellulosilytica]|uniref:TlpA family protein disulfide reductase n=1 Tax=Evansella halocellulosilytica TaxID=2011013 RepID=UPI000BB8C101|nr:redoxin family protein [Evansella halocellulosilytica]